MGRTLLAAGGIGTAGLTATNNHGLGQSSFNNTSTTEALAQVKLRAAGQVMNFASASIKNPGSYTQTVRVNGSNTALAASPSGVQVVEDTHVVSVANGDLICSQDTSPANTPTCAWSRAVFIASSGHVAHYFGVSGVGVAAGVGVTRFLAPSNVAVAFTAEANAKQRIRVAGTMSGLYIYISTNAATGSGTVTSRLNGGAGAMSITIGAGLTGAFEDTSNGDTVASGDDWNIQFASGTGGSGTNFNVVGVAFTATSGASQDVFATASTTSGDTRAASASNSYYSPVGATGSNGTELNRRFRFGFDSQLSKMRINVVTNTYGANGTMTSRVNGGAGAQSVTITAGVTGIYEDSTNTDTINAGDDFNYAIVGGTSGSIAYTFIGSTLTDNTIMMGQAIF